jgi:ribosomal protein L11 methylase PrmA
MTMSHSTGTTVLERIPASFRDPGGHVYVLNNRIVRTVLESRAEDFNYVLSTGILDTLAQARMVLPFEQMRGEIPASADFGDVKAWLEVPRLPFVSFPYEWVFSGLKAAALLHLDVHLAALDAGVTLSDASAYNIQFSGARPIFIDHLSFRRYRDGEFWLGHRQFCEQFLIPLLLHSRFGVPHNSWYRGTLEGIPLDDFARMLRLRDLFNWDILTHIVVQSWFQRATSGNTVPSEELKAPAVSLPRLRFRRMLDKLRRWIAQLRPAGAGKTVWQDYETTHSYKSEEMTRKRAFVVQFVRERRPKQLWDLGCNTGEFSRLALQEGADYVVGFDMDHGALETCFTRASQDSLALQTIVTALDNPSPSQGWRERERQGLQERTSADALVALALVHHLAIARNIPLGQIVDWLVRLAPAGVVEFIPKTDPMVQRLLSLREDIFPNYSLDNFSLELARNACIVRTAQLSPNGRTLFWYERL